MRPSRRSIAALPAGFTLIECLLVVVMLAIAVPVTGMFLDSRAGDQADAVQATRASALAQGVMEHILADASSSAPGLGYAAFADASQYLSDPATGLYARLEDLLAYYEDAGLACDVTISDPVSITGAATANPASDLFRIVTVRVTGTTTRGTPLDVAIESMVTSR